MKRVLPFTHFLGIQERAEISHSVQHKKSVARDQAGLPQSAQAAPASKQLRDETSQSLSPATTPQAIASQIIEAGKKRRGEIPSEPETHGTAYAILAAARKRRGELLEETKPEGVAGQIIAAAAKARNEK